MLRRKIVIHTIIAIISFFALSGVQFFLLYNTYELKNEHYVLTCASCIEKAYGNSIKDDKVYPGGARILDRYLLGNMDMLEQAASKDSGELKTKLAVIRDSLIDELKAKNNMDSVFLPLGKNPRIRNMEYALFLSMLEITFNGTDYYPICEPGNKDPYGTLIGGTLDHSVLSNAIGSLTIGSGNPRTYRLRTQLFAETADRRSAIIRLMLPTFLLSVLSILSVTIISFLAFRNWARQKNLSEMKSDFINSITHEFHTPLATIIVANRTLSNRMLTTSIDQIEPLSNVIQRQTERLKGMIARVLDITTLNRIVPVPQTLSMHHMLEEIIQDYRVKAAAHTEILFMPGAQADTVQADPFWFTTIILNILDNAVKYNDKDKKTIVVSTRSNRKHLVVQLQDNGSGMDAATRKHIFEKFYRAPEQVKKESKGLGLGLYFVQMAILAHHWKIEVDSKPGQGSTFSIIIPN